MQSFALEGERVSTQPGGFRGRIEEMAERFREKGATAPEKAMTIQELGLPPRFEAAMRRRLGSTGIFVETGGKYYLDEARLKQFEEKWTTRRGWSSRRDVLDLRIARMVTGTTAIVLILVNIFLVQDLYLRYTIVALVVLWVVLSVVQIYYVSKVRSQMGRGQVF